MKPEHELEHAVLKGDTHQVRRLAQLTPISAKVFQEACRGDSAEIVAILIDHQAPIHHNNDICLYWAIKGGNLAIVKLLVQSSIDPKQSTHNPLFHAEEGKHYEIVKYLLNECSYRPKQQEQALLQSYGHQHSFDILNSHTSKNELEELLAKKPEEKRTKRGI